MSQENVRTAQRLGESRDQSDETVAGLFKEWIARAELPSEQAEIHMAFAKSEVENRLLSYKRKGSWWRVAQVAIWLVVALLGLLGATLAATQTAETVAVVAGGLVATLTAFTSAAHPGRQADGYTNARLAIRDRAWDLLNKTGNYKGLETDEARFERFAGELRDIVHSKRTDTQFQL